MAAVTVTLNLQKHEQRPSHHANDTKTLFKNPWPSYTDNGFLQVIQMQREMKMPPIPPKEELPKVVKPDWGKSVDVETYHNDIKATWLGHACFLVEFPSSQPGQRGYRVLFDPVFEKRCSPSQWVGPARFTPPPFPIEEMPEIDAVVISHCHYDHLSVNTIKHLNSAAASGTVHFFAPLGNKKWFESIGVKKDNVTELDWWDSATVAIPTDQTELLITCTPSQHFANRSLFDKNCTLWASWAVEQVGKGGGDKDADAKCKVWFGGDTAYRGRPKGTTAEDDHRLPFCPAFKEIGERFGGFDFAMIPIGAYSPSWFMSQIHVSPDQALEIHQDVRSRRSIGMHYGCWMLTDEPINEPIERLKAATKAAGMPEEDFATLGAIGATMRVTPGSAT